MADTVTKTVTCPDGSTVSICNCPPEFEPDTSYWCKRGGGDYRVDYKPTKDVRVDKRSK